MEHHQKDISCGVCGRQFIVDVFSIGTTHQTIKAVTCRECAIKVGGNIISPYKE